MSNAAVAGVGGAGTGNVGSAGAEPSVRTCDTTGRVGPLSTLVNAVAGGTFGNIGAELFRLAKPFDMTFIAHDPYVDPGVAAGLGVRLVGLEELFAQSDVLSVSCPLNEATHHIVNAERLALMKPSAYLINTSRGPVVDEAALTEALQKWRIAGAERLKGPAWLPPTLALGLWQLDRRDEAIRWYAAAVRTEIRQLDPNLPVSGILTSGEVLAKSLGARRFNMLLLTGYACVALALCSVGIYGLLAQIVGRRTHEIGVRMALGAHSTDVVRHVLRDTAIGVAAGSTAGLVAAVLLSYLVRHMLFGISPKDPVVYAIVVEASIVEMFIAAFIPGFIAVIFFLITIAIYVRVRPNAGPAGERVPRQEFLEATVKVAPVILIFGVVIGGIYFGFFNPTPAAAVGVFMVAIQ